MLCSWLTNVLLIVAFKRICYVAVQFGKGEFFLLFASIKRFR